MAALDESNSPIKGFQLIHHPEGLYLACRGRRVDPRVPTPCNFFIRIKRLMYLEEVLAKAADHRAECKAPIQLASRVPALWFIREWEQ